MTEQLPEKTVPNVKEPCAHCGRHATPEDRMAALYAALAIACDKAPTVYKTKRFDGTGGGPKGTYAGNEAVMEAVRISFAGLGLSVIPTAAKARTEELEVGTSQQPFKKSYVWLDCTYRLAHEGGGSIDGDVLSFPVDFGKGSKSPAMAVASSRTSAYCYYMRNLLRLEVDEMEDINNPGPARTSASTSGPKQSPGGRAPAKVQRTPDEECQFFVDKIAKASGLGIDDAIERSMGWRGRLETGDAQAPFTAAHLDRIDAAISARKQALEAGEQA